MKTFMRILPILVFLFFLPAGCGYHNPYVYNGPSIHIYLTNWKNRTNELRLESQIYQSLAKWYQKSGSIRIQQSKEGADFILAGEITSISIPALSYGANNITTESKLHLTVRYILKNIKTEKILFEVPKDSFSETYSINSSVSETKDNESKALEIAIEDLSERIYLKTLDALRTQNSMQAAK